MKLLVTGASGFLGRNLVSSVPSDWDVVGVYNRSLGFPGFLAENGLRHVRPVQADLSTRAGAEAVAGMSRTFDVVVHFAANGDPAVSAERPGFDLVSNALTVVSLLEVITCGRFILMSSGAVYDGLAGAVSPDTPVEPRLPYAISKFAGEHYLSHFQRQGRVQEILSVRFFGAYGPHEPPRKIYTRLVRQFALARDPRFTIRGDGSNLIDAMYVSDAMKALNLLLTAPAELRTVDLATGRPLTLTGLVQAAARAFDLEPEIRYEGAVPECINFWSVDPYMVEQLGFHVEVPLEDGLRRLCEHLGSN